MDWAERDRLEAICLDRQKAIAGPGITIQNIIDLNRFCDCCDDGEGYDVPKARMKELKVKRLVDGGDFGYYTSTDEGERIRAAWFNQSTGDGHGKG